MSPTVWGILAGLFAAVCHSGSYIATRVFVLRRHQGSLRLLIIGHLWMGLFSLALLPVFWPEVWPSLDGLLLPLLGTSVFYLIGQIGLFWGLRYTDASTISPLLTVKIFALALVSVVLLNETVVPLQWAAVGLAVAGGILLNYSGGKIDWHVLLAIVLACAAYTGSDTCIRFLVRAFDQIGIGSFRAIMLSVILSYALCGLIAVVAWPFAARHTRKADWLYALPFALFWYGAMVGLFAAFTLIDLVYGAILQSLRGLLSILLGAVIARLGWVHLEQRHGRGVLARRILAGLMMLGAIALYHAGRSENPRPAGESAKHAPAQAVMLEEDHEPPATHPADRGDSGLADRPGVGR